MAANAAVGTSFASLATGAVGAFGTAGTGAAISGLSGAALNSATLAWIGGLVGGGMVAGGVLLTAGALGAGVYGSMRFRRAILGHARRREELSERQARIMEAAAGLTVAGRAAPKGDKPISGLELALLSRIGVAPLADSLDDALASGSFADLNVISRLRLRGHLYSLRSHCRKLESHADPS